MPHVAKFNAKSGVSKYVDIAHAMGRTLDVTDAGKFVADTLFEMNNAIDLPLDLKAYAVTPEELQKIVHLTAVASSTKKNPVPADEAQIREILLPLI